MKTFLSACVMCALVAGSANAQSTKIELSADVNRTSCELVDQGGFFTIYVFQTGSFQSTAVRFKAAKPACWLGATWVGDSSTYVSLGNSQTDWSVAYGACKTLPVLVGQINYQAAGASLPCCEAVVTAPPIEFVYTDCSFAEHPLVPGQKVVINPDQSCPCNLPLATEQSTWGRVKSLYR